MAGRLREEDITAIREQILIEDVIKEYVTLKSAGGGSLKGLCPFHEERSPSFHVTPSRKYWHCFGCGEGGDVFAFVQGIEHVGFIDAVEILADRIGLELKYNDDVPGERVERSVRMRLVGAHAEAAEYYRKQMLTAEAQTGVKFLSDRGFDFEMAGQFSVGYAPKGWDNLSVYLKGKGYSEEELVTGGLATAREGSNGVYDKFRGRLIWPIKNAAGEVIGFGARKLYDDDQGPKYLNTSETPLYKKSQVLYGIDLARKEIATRRQAVIVEGYTDVMACHLAGIPTAVAACGTAFGGEHIGILRRILRDDDKMKGEVIFTFDGDAAGQKAALRAFEEDQRFVARTFVAVEPNGMDPCEVRMARGDEGVRRLLADRVPLFEFAIKSMLTDYDVSTPEGRVAGLKQAAPIVAAIKDPTLRPEYTRLLSGWLGLDVAMVRRAVNQAGSQAARDDEAKERTTAAGKPAAVVQAPEWGSEREALKCVLQFPVESSEWFNVVEGSAWTKPVYREVFDAVFRADPSTGKAGSSWVEAVLKEVNGNTDAASTVRELIVEPLMSESPAYINSAIAQVIALDAERRINDLKAKLVQSAGDNTTQAKLMRELMEMENYRREILATVHADQ